MADAQTDLLLASRQATQGIAEVSLVLGGFLHPSPPR
jgi:hypothetical protein